MDPTVKASIDGLTERLNEAYSMLQELQQNPKTRDHEHNGNDFSQVNWKNIAQRHVYVPYTIPGTSSATSTNYSTFFIVPAACVVNGFMEVHAGAGTDASAVTLQLEKLTGTTAPGSGVSVLGSALSLKVTANTVQTATITTAAGNRTLAMGNRLALKSAGTLTAVANVSVVVDLIMI